MGKKDKVAKSVAKYESTLYTHYETQPIYSTQKVLFLDRFQSHESYETSVRVGNKLYSNGQIMQYNKQSRLSAVGKAFTDLSEEKFPTVGPKPSATKTVTDNLSVHEWAETLSNETIALLFKDILRRFADENQIVREKYTTCVHHEGSDLVGYTSQLDISGETFKSLGLMTNEDQAEQSAAEICLRTFGYLPEVDSERDLTIQPFLGGFLAKGFPIKKPYLLTSKLSSDILEAFVASRSLMLPPKYYVKYAESQSKKDGEERVMNCICCIDGKVFEQSISQPESLAIQLAAEKAVNYFGISRAHERMEFRKHLHLFRPDFYRKENLLSGLQPSKSKSWLWSCFARENSYEECKISKTVQGVLESPLFVSNLPTVVYQNTLIAAEVKQNPSFREKLLSGLNDVCVADIDVTNPNLVTIGNSDFSIKMWCTDGKIYSKRRKCSVEISPGHNIHQLSCEYRASLPSLEVYLHAVDCVDLYYPNPPKPVVTSCGVVVLFHDYSASPNDIYVLIQQKVDYKEGKVSRVASLKVLLHKLIQPTLETEMTAAQAMGGIEQWEEDDVKLLSEMSMDSLNQVMSKYLEYDSRWNELFAKLELPEELKEVQDICLNELKRLEEEKAASSNEDEAEAPQQWELPQSEFMSRFDDTGICIEGSESCGMRSLAEKTGMKISLGDIGKCSVIDIPVEDDEKRHRGDISRYYMWNKIEKESVPKAEDADTELLKGYTLFEKMVIQHNSRRYIYSDDHNRKVARIDDYLQNVQYINADGTKVSPNFINPSKVGDFIPKDNVTVFLPGDAPFANYRKSLYYAIKMNGLEAPYFGKQKKTGKCISTVKFLTRERKYFFRSEPCNSFSVGDELVCKKALEALGYKTPAEFDTELSAETKNGEESMEVDSKGVDIEPSDDTDEPNNEEESKEDDNQVSESLPEDVDPYSITTDVVEKKIPSDDEYSHIDDDDVRVIEGNTEEEKDEEVKKEESAVNENEGNIIKSIRSNAKRRAAKRQTERRNDFRFGPKRKLGEINDLPLRDVFRLQCEWMILDKAIDVCPMLKTVAETTQFQDQLNWFVSELAKK